MRAHKGSPSKYGISSHLAIACPATKHQRNLVSIIPHQNTMKDLMDDVNAGISLKKAIRSRMNNLAEIGGRSGLINSDERNQRLKERLQLLASQAETAETTNAAKASKKKAAQSDLSSILPEALHLYDSVDADIDSTAFPRAFTKKFAKAILFLIFGVTMSASTKKQDMIDPPSSPDSDEEVHVPTTAAARSMSGYLYRWSLRSHPENALDLALAVFNVVNEIHHNNVARHHWFTLLAKRLRGLVGMSEAMDLALHLTSDDMNEELCMGDLVEDDALSEENIRNAATL
jgi:hypothetical protein